MDRSSRESAVRLKTAWREYGRNLKRGAVPPSLRIGLAATFTANTLVDFLGGTLVEADVHPLIEVGPYNQIFQVCHDHTSAFDPACQVIILLFRLEDIAFDEINAHLLGDAAAGERAARKIDSLASALAGLRIRFPGTIIVNLPPFPVGMPVHAMSLENPQGLGALHRTLTSHFEGLVEKIKGIFLCDLDAVQRHCGLDGSFDARTWYLYRQPFSEYFLSNAGALLARMVLALRQPLKKCVVLDCDNTLWGGIIGEDGIGGIELGDEFPGTAYRDFQRFLLYLHSRGILLALASKNNEAEVWEVFDKHGGMLLKRENLTAWQINWNAKSEGVIEIARALNIGTDSLVFIDDSAMEIESMRAALPEVACVLLPEDPADIISCLKSLTFFDRMGITSEDRERSEMMHVEQRRQASGEGLSKEAFLQSLELRLDFFRAQPPDLERLVQLINKTNQFNLTTIRRSLDEIRFVANSPKHRLFGLRVSDKFGDYGLTGAALVEIDRSDDCPRWIVDTFLLSCRVLGRNVETAFLAAMAREARAEGVHDLIASFIPSAKNASAASFLSTHGFASLGDNRWRIALSEIPEISTAVSLLPNSREKSK